MPSLWDLALVIYLKAYAWQPGAGRKGDNVGPTFASHGPISAPMLALRMFSRMLPQVGPLLALCWPMSALRWPYVGPMLAQVGPMLALGCAIVTTNFADLCKNPFNTSFLPSRAPAWTPKPRKTRRFFHSANKKSWRPKGPKERKTRCFWTAGAKITEITGGPRASTRRRARISSGPPLLFVLLLLQQ